MRVAAALLIATTALAACGDLGMDRQPRDTAQGPAVSLLNGSEEQTAPVGAVALGEPLRDAEAVRPPPVSLALLARGRDRYGIACAPCHGEGGRGDGAIVMRGFPAPQPLDEGASTALSGRQIYDVITAGYGVMLPQAERVSPTDRWAVVAYLRALTLSHRSPAPSA